MGEHMLDTGNIAMKGSIAQSTIDTFNFIFDVRPAGRVRPRLVRVRLAPCVRVTAMETRTLIRKEWIPDKDEEKKSLADCM